MNRHRNVLFLFLAFQQNLWVSCGSGRARAYDTRLFRRFEGSKAARFSGVSGLGPVHEEYLVSAQQLGQLDFLFASSSRTVSLQVGMEELPGGRVAGLKQGDVVIGLVKELPPPARRQASRG